MKADCFLNTESQRRRDTQRDFGYRPDLGRSSSPNNLCETLRLRASVLKPETRNSKLETAYKQCLERERIRERDWRRTNQGAFEAGLLHLDFEEEEERERNGSVSWPTDRGRGAAEVRACGRLSVDELKDDAARRVNRARMALARKMPDCLPTFWLVLKHRTDRDASILETMKRMGSSGPCDWNDAKRLYTAQLKKILNFFEAQ